MAERQDPADISISDTQRKLLTSIAAGLRLKDHRDIEGSKRYVLYDLDA